MTTEGMVVLIMVIAWATIFLVTLGDIAQTLSKIHKILEKNK